MIENASRQSEDGRKGAEIPPPCRVVWPVEQTAPLILSSPHSGHYYPADFVAASKLDAVTLRRSEDCFVETLYEAAPRLGLPLIAANYARAYVDCNRDAFELDPLMFSDRLPDYVNRTSTGVQTGFGTVPRRVTPDHEIYAGPLAFKDARQRIEAVHRPYHAALAGAVARTRAQFGCAFLIDAHSMPTLCTSRPGERPAAFVLGDRYGETAPRGFVDEVESFIEDHGFVVARNTPYAGGFITRHYARPAEQCFTLQIELDRALYMDQDRFEPAAGFAATQALISGLLDVMADWTRRWKRKWAAE